jgi:alginate production protein
VLETKGPWEVKGSVVIFRQPWANRLVSLRLSEIDLEKSHQLTALAGGEAPDIPELPVEVEQEPEVREVTLSETRRTLVEEIDDERPTRQKETRLFGRPLIVGGSLSASADYESGRSLDEEAVDDEVEQTGRLRLDLLYEPTETVTVFAEAAADSQTGLYREDGEPTISEFAVSRGRTWIHWAPERSGVSFQLGRQSFQEPRQWWWSRRLDALRFRHRSKRVRLEIGVAQELAPVDLSAQEIDPDEEDVLRLLGSLSWRYAKRHHLGLFYLDQADDSSTQLLGERIEARLEDDIDADLTWLGLRLHGSWKLGKDRRLTYWLDGGYVHGQETLYDFDDDLEPGFRFVDGLIDQTISGWAMDGALTWKTRLPGRPAFTLGYARGSADDRPDDGEDGSFRQTGLHRNKMKFGGEESYRMYGEILDPELSNLQIGTFVVGFPLLRSSSFDIASHFYRQVVPSPYLRGDRLRVNPTGVSTDIGTAVDLILAFEEWEHWRIKLIGSAFRAGSAFGEREGQTVFDGDLKISLIW